MNDLEKKSFYSFLALYIGSSFLFVLLLGYWYYTSQKNSLESATYYKMQHIADTISSLIINAHMHKTPLILPEVPNHYEYSFIMVDEKSPYNKSYFESNGLKVLVSSSVQNHLNIKYVVVKTDEYDKYLRELKNSVLIAMAVVFLLIGIISYFLAKLFMKPIRQKVLQIENFVQDISHELNTPVTALQMSSQRALSKGVYDEKILKNISISTKQLYTIYQSLTYLNFTTSLPSAKEIPIKPVVQESIEYYTELLSAKSIRLQSALEDARLMIVPQRASLLFSNLLSNAIKYSLPHTTITITLKQGYLSIKDEGVGIPKEKLQAIFTLYERGSDIAGGFGVGLSIVKQICDEYGIKIEVNSKEGIGSEFVLKW